LCFLASLPFSWMAFQEYTRKDAEAAAAAHPAPLAPAIAGERPAVTPPSEDSERPSRLN
jgi:hypothetical protein